MKSPTDFILALAPALLLIWLVYDVIVAFCLPSTSQIPTITRRVQSLSHSFPAIPFLAGFLGGLLAGHFWGNF